ncbi:MAG: hypothetical protein ACXWRE_00470 [Pseudobdellovibrionaceae bacterium]
MRKMSELMMELGFNQEASHDVKEAFIKYLLKTSEGTRDSEARIKVLLEPRKPEQLSFSFLNELKPTSSFLRKTRK